MFGRIFNFLNVFSIEEKNSPPKKNNNSSLKSKESLAILSTQVNSQCVLPDDQSGKNTTNTSLQTNLQFSEDDVKNVLQDFEKLDFKNSNECFNEIAKDYKRRKKSDLFNYVILNKRKYITDILDQRLAHKDQENFRKKFSEYLLEINEEMNYGKEFQNKLQFFEDRVEEVLSDFRKLNFGFKDNLCKDDKDNVNYNKGWPADPFDKIANYYRWNKNIFLFNYVVLSKQKEIISILNEKSIPEDKQKNFKKRLGRYLLRTEEGMSNGHKFLKTDSVAAFFDGCYVPCAYAKRSLNHYDHLNINIFKPGYSLEISRLFTDKIEEMERNKNEVKIVEIYSNDKRIATIEKNDNGQRNYYFVKDATCDMKIMWSAEDEKGNSVNCSISLNVNPGEIKIGQSTINGKDVELDEILKLAEQNGDVLIEGEALYEFLGRDLEQDVQSQKEEIVTLEAAVPVSLISFSFDSLKPGELEARCIGGAYDHYLPRTRLEGPSAEEKLHLDYRKWDR
ncbi:hypothetical protein BBB02_00260 [Wolbachia endosymbiont of Bemisia tabaci]|uniref:hypothetical protein n=1 Tax=Wolbachia endosymbiont of Bemisia tabaci TaxID=215173 RepID=UPI000FD18231|nr:hypothetical protein [Wolbachia endosymbiont of Bemisia tabaci]AZU37089.1 hypothetical protein BBB02_00260 [Wolbachia endosymbiont of Bemisia tabaci]